MQAQSSNSEMLDQAIDLLSDLIQTPSFSREEDATARIIQEFFEKKNIPVERIANNVVVKNKSFDKRKPTLLLNSHHDTVKPNKDYTKDPFEPSIENGKLFGLGSNDAGGALVSLISAFLHVYDEDIPINVLLAATGEEEISGLNGIGKVLLEYSKIDFGIVGEPTEMKAATSEKGLMVLDCLAKGKSGHAARSEGMNAIYEAMNDIHWFKTFKFPKTSPKLGPIHMNVTMIESGSQHNVVPDACKFTVDVRTIDTYTNEETLAIIKQNVSCDVVPRSTRLQPSGISLDHPLVKSLNQLEVEMFGSPTLSDQALMPFPTIKVGPGKSERSHTADEFIYLDEIKEGIDEYIRILEHLFTQNSKTL